MRDDHQADLNRWVSHGLLSDEQRDAILAFEQVDALPRHTATEPEAQSRLASAVSTVGAAVAIAAVTGIMAIVASDWSSTQAAIAAAVGSAVMLVAASQLVRRGWGAPAGLFAICGLILMPVALGFTAHALGWWPDGDTDAIVRRQQRVGGVALLLAVLPGMLTVRLGLKQAWTMMPIAAWYGVALLVADPFATIGLVVTQVVVGVAVAAYATFVWDQSKDLRASAWWLQLGGLLLAGQGIIFSGFDERAIYALLGVLTAAVVFTVGVTLGRTAWVVAGALSATAPAIRLIFEYFEGLGGLSLVAALGLVLAFLPLLLRRHKAQDIA